jgi:nitrate reductase NapAB chaperone NapD
VHEKGRPVVIASGFVEVNGINHIRKIVGELKRRRVNIEEIESEKILFLMEKDSVDAVKAEIDSLRVIENIKNVHLTYYSIENRKGGS